jgi:hypothetical protein
MSASVMILEGGPIIGGKIDGGPRYRFLSPETRKQGWVFFYLEPGIHYLVFEGMASAAGMYYSPRYEVKIPENSPVVYIGSMHLYCESPYDRIERRDKGKKAAKRIFTRPWITSNGFNGSLMIKWH